MAARFSVRIRKRSLNRLASMDIPQKEKEILFLRDKVYQLKTQVSILQKRIKKQQKRINKDGCGRPTHGVTKKAYGGLDLMIVSARSLRYSSMAVYPEGVLLSASYTSLSKPFTSSQSSGIPSLSESSGGFVHVKPS
ncbi:MAG: hypothetical protein ACYS74_08625, partial [Planctomycetota bacterium]